MPYMYLQSAQMKESCVPRGSHSFTCHTFVFAERTISDDLKVLVGLMSQVIHNILAMAVMMSPWQPFRI